MLSLIPSHSLPPSSILLFALLIKTGSSIILANPQFRFFQPQSNDVWHFHMNNINVGSYGCVTVTETLSRVRIRLWGYGWAQILPPLTIYEALSVTLFYS